MQKKKSKTKLAQSITEAINKENNTGGQKNAKDKKKESETEMNQDKESS